VPCAGIAVVEPELVVVLGVVAVVYEVAAFPMTAPPAAMAARATAALAVALAGETCSGSFQGWVL
jgi:hypothetical protein